MSAMARTSRTSRNLKRWFEAIKARPAVAKVYASVKPSYSKPVTEEERKVLFGQTAPLSSGHRERFRRGDAACGGTPTGCAWTARRARCRRR